MSIRIGTRGSKLALIQTEIVAKKLAELGIATEQTVISTAGDTTTQVPLHEIGGQGVFVRALDDAILAGEIDCAVHSMKDIPAYRPSGLVTAAILKRDPPADFLAYRGSLSAVKIVGTSSTRRRAQLLRHDPSVTIQDLRGNVDTRIRKLGAGEYDAIVLAEAGLRRMDIRIQGERLPPEKFVPSPNQGTIAVVCRADPSLREVLSVLDHPQTRTDVMIERAVMEQLGGGCFTPLGIYCNGGHLIAEVLSLDGARAERIETDITTIEEAREQGRQLKARAQGLIDEAYQRLGIAAGPS
ncbi:MULTISPECIES: hydroxymethylbilane synthase [unclassified Methanoregula]|uniref:hydroxymethylbilane synthase n=1 Tax=unclassified Methanoregula TaxID=2649730 RepID=UPI0009D3E01D|nr:MULTISPECIES: hydroxymethylbilane synthase [unclassified Methanoregula]OPX63858.1 MAG: porphobilinogen deaminase [Methanoregula sp. PtaB.Bin085]OPY35411.1 MAG: porphobilinogen deaminase [Methanoregula sp. PtaU1.Bin006]